MRTHRLAWPQRLVAIAAEFTVGWIKATGHPKILKQDHTAYGITALKFVLKTHTRIAGLTLTRGTGNVKRVRKKWD